MEVFQCWCFVRIPPREREKKHLQFTMLECLSHGYAESLGWAMVGFCFKVMD